MPEKDLERVKRIAREELSDGRFEANLLRIQKRAAARKVAWACFLGIWAILAVTAVKQSQGFADDRRWCELNVACPYGSSPTYSSALDSCACSAGGRPPRR